MLNDDRSFRRMSNVAISLSSLLTSLLEAVDRDAHTTPSAIESGRVAFSCRDFSKEFLRTAQFMLFVLQADQKLTNSFQNQIDGAAGKS